MNDMTPMSMEELHALAILRSANLSDSAIQIAWCIGDHNYHKLPELLRDHGQTVQILAGLVSQLLPVGPTPKEPENKC